MNQFSGKWAAIKHSHGMDRLEGSTSAGKALDAIAGTGSAVATVGAVVAPAAALAFGIARATFVGLGLFRKAWKFGRPSIDQMIEDIETGADAKFREIDSRLDGNDSAKKDFDARLQCQEAEAARLSALFHGLRSSDPEKHKRLGAMTIAFIFAGDLKPEGLDGMMRAAVELKEADIFMLGKLYTLEKPLLDRMERVKRGRPALMPNLHGEVQNIWHNFARSLNPAEQLEYRSSFARLQSHGMIQQVTFSNSEVGREPYLLLEEGAKFYERLQEIALQR